MKIQIDTTAKTIKVEGNINLSDLFDALQKLLPEEEWKNFSLQAVTVIEWVNPITIPYVPYVPYVPTQPYVPWYGSPIITCGTFTDYTLNSGVYNIQI